MSILQVDLKIPGGTDMQEPLLRTTTFVAYVPSKPSSALYKSGTNEKEKNKSTNIKESIFFLFSAEGQQI